MSLFDFYFLAQDHRLTPHLYDIDAGREIPGEKRKIVDVLKQLYFLGRHGLSSQAEHPDRSLLHRIREDADRDLSGPARKSVQLIRCGHDREHPWLIRNVV